MAPLIIPAVTLIAEYLPNLLRLFKNDKAAEVADMVGDIAKRVTGTETVDDATEALKANPDLILQFKQSVLAHEETMEKIVLERERLYVGDVQDARKYRDEKTFWLGVSIMATFLITVVLVLFGGYSVIVGKVAIDAGLFAAISGTIGTIVGYVAANAQSVINYFFGSSHGSMQKSDEMADAVKRFKK